MYKSGNKFGPFLDYVLFYQQARTLSYDAETWYQENPLLPIQQLFKPLPTKAIEFTHLLCTQFLLICIYDAHTYKEYLSNNYAQM